MTGIRGSVKRTQGLWFPGIMWFVHQIVGRDRISWHFPEDCVSRISEKINSLTQFLTLHLGIRHRGSLLAQTPFQGLFCPPMAFLSEQGPYDRVSSVTGDWTRS